MAHNNFKLKVEVVRFNEKDVIATSGAGSLLNNEFGSAYLVLPSEFVQSKNPNKESGATTGPFYMFVVDSDGSTWYADYDVDYDSSDYQHYNYAWYNEKYNTWGTDEQLISYYNNSLPTGIDN